MDCIRVMVFIEIIFILALIVILCIYYLKKIIVKIYNKWEKRGMLSQNIAYPIGEIYKDINCKREIYFFFSFGAKILPVAPKITPRGKILYAAYSALYFPPTR